MSLYTFYFLDRNGSVPEFQFEDCADDAAAANCAAEMLARRPERSAVEIWRGDQLIAPCATRIAA